MDGKKLAVVKELHRPARRNYQRRHVDVRGLDETWQADLVNMSAYARENRGYRYLLTVIDIFSKFAWAVPTKSKNAKDVTAALRSVLAKGRIPKKLHVDQGREFYNSEFKDLMQKHEVKTILKRPKFKIGDRVRISKFKHIFEKGYTPNWTTEIFTVSRVKNTDPVTYNLKDYQDHSIEGGFYEHELTSVKYPDIYLVEKILRKRGNKLFVKWLGFDGSHNIWIDKSDL
ncbi:uncharacterized protein LOC107270880 [Cephus cinctus]|uniref:Uncharacterized protein LOC107270880 n=1 Tax=Cephus cinctus TaxID=211228 RepID=A0AAJ7C4R7_CEPCN|nr:uncharacterized protein LOC107270880 [Cephus cinctus]